MNTPNTPISTSGNRGESASEKKEEKLTEIETKVSKAAIGSLEEREQSTSNSWLSKSWGFITTPFSWAGATVYKVLGSVGGLVNGASKLELETEQAQQGSQAQEEESTIENLKLQGSQSPQEPIIIESEEEQAQREKEEAAIAGLHSLQHLPNSNSNFFSNVHLDAIALQSEYEGLSLGIPLDYMDRLMKNKQFLSCFSDPEAIKEVTTRLSELKETSKEISETIKKCKENKYEPVKIAANNIANQVHSLAPNQSFMMPGGWAGKPSGHAMYYEFIKLENGNYDLYLYNAGAGSHVHASEDDRHEKRIAPFSYYKEIPPDKLFFGEPPSSKIFEELLLLQVRPLHEHSCDFSYDHVMASLLTVERFRSKPGDRAPLCFIAAQRSGSCSVKSLNALLYSYLRRTKGAEYGSRLYKEIAYYSKLLSLIGEHERLQANPWYITEKRYQLRCAARFLLRRIGRIQACQTKGGCAEAPLSKRMMQAGIDKAKEILENLDRIEAEEVVRRAKEGGTSFETAVAGSTNSPASSDLVKSVYQAIQPLETARNDLIDKASKEKPMENHRVTSSPQFSSAENLVTYLKELESILPKQSEEVKGCRLALAHDALLKIPLPTQGSVWDGVTKEQAQEILSHIKSIQGNLYKAETLEGSVNPVRTHNTAMTVAILAFHCAQKTEPLLKSYCLDSRLYHNLFSDVELYTIRSPALFRRRQELLAYLSKELVNKRPLFDPTLGGREQFPSEEEFKKIPLFQFYLKLIDKSPKYKTEYLGLSPPTELFQYFENRKDKKNDWYMACLNLWLGDSSLPNEQLLDEISKDMSLAQTVIFQSQLMLAPLRKERLIGPLKNREVVFNAPFTDPSNGRETLVYVSNRSKDESARADGSEFKVVRELFGNQLPLIDGSPAVAAKRKERPSENRYIGYVSRKMWFLPLDRVFLSGEAQPLELVRFIGEYKQLFKESDKRILLEVLLYHRAINPDGSEEIPLFSLMKKLGEKPIAEEGFWIQAQAVLKEGLELYSKTGPSQKPELEPALWFMRISQRLRTACLQQTGKKAPDLLERERALLESWLAAEGISKQDKLRIQLHLVNHYRQNNPEHFNTEEWQGLYQHWAALQSEKQSVGSLGKECEVLFEELSVWVTELEDVVASLELKQKSQIARAVLESFSLEVLESWKVEAKGSVVTFKSSANASFYSLNLYTGKIISDKGLVTKVFNPAWKETHHKLFGIRDLEFVKDGNRLHFTDPLLGKMQIVLNASGNLSKDFSRTFYRQIEGKWHAFIPEERYKTSQIPKIFLEGYTHWIPQEPRGGGFFEESTMVFTDRAKGTNDYQLALTGSEGIRPYGAGKDSRRTVTNFQFLSFFTGFEDPSWLVLWEKSPSERVLEFSRYKSARGAPLSLVSSEKDWVLANNPKYKLTAVPEGHPLGAFREALFFKENGTERYKLILPYKNMYAFGYRQEGWSHTVKGKQDIEYMEYEWSPGCAIRSPDKEAALHLSHLFLLQKNYEASFNCLKGLSLSDKLTPRMVEMVERIVSLDKIGVHDLSPNSHAIRLQAYLKVKKINPFQGLKDFNTANLETLYQGYLQDLDLVDEALRLSPDDESALIESFGGYYYNISSTVIDSRRNELEGLKVYASEPFFSGAVRVRDWDEADQNLYADVQLDPIKNELGWLYDYKQEEGEPKSHWRYHFLGLYKILGNTDPSNQVKRRELAYEIEKSKGKLIVGDTEMPKAFLHLFFKLYKNPDAFPADISALFSSEKNKKAREEIIQAIYDAAKPPIDPPESLPAAPTSSQTVGSKTLQKMPLLPPSPLERRKSPHSQERGQNISMFNKSTSAPADLAEKLIQQQSREEEPTSAEYSTLAIAEEELTSTEQQHASVIAAEVANYEEELRLGLSKMAQEIPYTLKEGVSLETLQKKVTEVKKEKEDYCKKVESELLRLVKRRSSIPEDRMRQEIEDASGLSPTLRLTEIIRASLQPGVENQQAAFRALNWTLTDQEITKLREMTLIYMEEHVYLEQLKRSLGTLEKALAMGEEPLLSEDDKSERSNLLQTAYTTLAAGRHYKVSENPEALLFEYLSGLQVRPVQAKLIQNVIQGLFEAEEGQQDFSAIFQLTMGGGKTSVVLSQLIHLTAKKKLVPLFLCHHSQFNSVIGNLSGFQQQRFGQELVLIDYSREELGKEEVLNHILKTLKEAEAKGHSLIMETPMIQVLQLELIAVLEVLKSGHDYKLEERTKKLREILSFLKEKCVGLLDEVDLNLNLLTGVHFPLGRKCQVKKERIDLIQGLYEYVGTDPRLKELVKLAENRQAELTSQQYQESVLPLLVAHVTDKLLPFFQEEEKKQQFHDYLMGKTDEGAMACYEALKKLSESENEEEKTFTNLAATAKQLLVHVLPLTLSKSYNRNYGRDAKGLEKVIPYQGVGTPATTEFGDTNESLCYSFQSALNGGVQEQQVATFAKKMQEAALKLAEISGNFRATEPARRFHQLIGIHLDEMELLGKLAEATQIINKDPKKRLVLEAESAFTQVTYHEHVLSSDPFALVGQLRQLIGCSGTVNEVALPLELRQKMLLDKGTEGRIITKLLSDAAEGKSLMHCAQTDQGLSVFLEQTLEGHPQKEKVQALVDAGGFLRHYNNAEVATGILHYYEADSRIKGVLFFQRDSKTGEEGFFIKKKGDNTLYPLRNTQKEEVEKYGLLITDLFIYYDELRCTGTDIPQNSNAINLLTVDPHKTTTRDALQATLRARGFFAGQKVDFVVDQATSSAFLGESNPPTTQDILRTLIKNQALSKAQQVPRAFLGQIKNTLRQQGIDGLLNTDEYVETYKQWRETLLTPSNEEDAFLRSGKPESYEESVEVIQQAAENAIKRAEGLCKEQTEKEKIETKLDLLVEASRRESFLPKKILRGVSETSGAEVEVDREVAQEVAQEVQQEVEKQSEVENELEQFNQNPRIIGLYTESSWNDNQAVQFEEKGLCPEVMTLQERFKTSFKVKEGFGLCFKGGLIRVTKNQAYSWTERLHPLHEASQRKKARFMLVHKDLEGNKESYTLVSQQEADFWIKRLEKKETSQHVHLITTGGVSAVPGRSFPKNSLLSLQEALWETNFFSGNLMYLSKPEQEALTKSKLAGVEGARRRRYLELASFSDPAQRQFFQANSLFNSKSSVNIPQAIEEELEVNEPKQPQATLKEDLVQVGFFARFFGTIFSAFSSFWRWLKNLF